MHWVSIGVALLVAVGVIAIGTMYLSNPRAATRSFGLPLPEVGANIAWWLRLKGVRDIVSGLERDDFSLSREGDSRIG